MNLFNHNYQIRGVGFNKPSVDDYEDHLFILGDDKNVAKLPLDDPLQLFVLRSRYATLAVAWNIDQLKRIIEGFSEDSTLANHAKVCEEAGLEPPNYTIDIMPIRLLDLLKMALDDKLIYHEQG